MVLIFFPCKTKPTLPSHNSSASLPKIWCLQPDKAGTVLSPDAILSKSELLAINLAATPSSSDFAFNKTRNISERAELPFKLLGTLVT